MMNVIRKILLWLMPACYLAVSCFFFFKGLDYLGARQNMIMGIVMLAYSAFRFYRSYKVSKASAAILLLLMLPFMSCNNNAKENSLDTPTTGKINMAVDETFMPVITAQLDVFHAVYQYAHITPVALPENKAFNLLFHDSTHLILASRQLTTKEVEYFNSKKVFPKQVKIAVDAIALIVNKENPDSSFTVANIKDILTGKITDWKQLNSKNKSGKIEVIFDNPDSGLIRYMADSVAGTHDLGNNLTASDRNVDVIEYVASHKNAAGFIGVSWISDKDDSTHMSFQSKVTTARLGLQSTDTFKPYQAYIATGQYPLTRAIYLISSDPHMGLADGFIAFAASDKGQRIILKAGILPATAPIRLIQVHDE